MAQLTSHQQQALLHLARIPAGYKRDVLVKAVGLRTARALARMGLIELHSDTGSRRTGYGGFGQQGRRAVVETYLDMTATVTPAGHAVVRSIQ